jgi:hypothetical protein
MKKVILILALIIPATLRGYSQQECARFGIEANQYTVQSGFSTSTELKVFVQDEKGKRLSLGLYYDSKFKNIGGIGISFIKMLGKNNKNKSLQPYIVYNLIYRMTYISDPIVSESYNIAAGTYSTFEHYLAFGLRTNLSDHFYLTNEIGYGIYFGSIMKPSKPDSFTQESYGTNGNGAIIKVGIGYFF